MSHLRSLVVIAVVAAGASLAGGCIIELTETIEGSGTPLSELRAVSAFTRLEVAGELQCTVELGTSATLVSVHGDDNLLEYLETEVVGDTLRVRVARGVRLEPTPEVTVRVPSLKGVELSGSGRLLLSGVAGERFECELAGSGTIRASGVVGRLVIERNGSGEIDLSELFAREAEVEANGSGYVYVHADKQLKVELNGSGRVLYLGQPNVSASTHGSGEVRPAGQR